MLINEIQEIETTEPVTNSEMLYLEKISQIDSELFKKYEPIVCTDKTLSRKVVSFQANKNRPFYRWFKFKEGFSAELVQNYIIKHGIKNTKNVFDPFAGSGATLFAASELGINSVGIELLPIGQELINVRNILLNNFTDKDFSQIIYWIKEKPWINHPTSKDYIILKITDGAYLEDNSQQIKKYLSRIDFEQPKIQSILRFALLCILENLSYTRKDGQYLRWDNRSGRRVGAKPFHKGEIKKFDTEITLKLKEIISDTQEPISTEFFDSNILNKKGKVKVIGGSCLEEIPQMESDFFDLIITSPPYCNRYDYTRTYALELSMLGIDDRELLHLRQKMLTCTVENREKDLLKINPNWNNVLSIAQKHELLQLILEYLEFKKDNKTINNTGIPRMIKGYFYEMSCVIFELYRVLRKNGQVIMVNDNVRYAGASISVDLILSSIAEKIGFEIQEISVLPIGKGNSSQQMGVHGRDPLRKCVYIWKKI